MDEAELRGAWSVPADRSGVPTRVTLWEVPPRRPVRTCALVNQRRDIPGIGAVRNGPNTDRIAVSGFVVRRFSCAGLDSLPSPGRSPAGGRSGAVARRRAWLKGGREKLDRRARLSRSAAASAAATAATAAASTGGRGGRGTAAARHGDSGQQFHRVVVALRTGRGRGGLSHWTADLERVAAGAAPILVTRHWHSVGLQYDGSVPGVRAGSQVIHRLRHGLSPCARVG